MGHRKVLIATAVVAIVAAACSSRGHDPVTDDGAAGQPGAGERAPASAPASASAAPVASIGPGEGELDLVVWPGYAEDGSNVKEYDWVNPFIAANPDCGEGQRQARRHVRRHVHAHEPGPRPVRRRVRLRRRLEPAHRPGRGRPDRPGAHPELQRPQPVPPEPAEQHGQRLPLRRVARLGRQHPDVPDGQVQHRPRRAGTPVFDPAQMGDYKGKVTAYAGTIYIADAALYLKAHQAGARDHRPVRADPGPVRRRGRRSSRASGRSSASTGSRSPTRSTTSPTARRRSARPGSTRRTRSRRPASRSRPSSRPRA